MWSQIKTHNSVCGVCGGQIDTKAVFLSEHFGITDFKISPNMTWYNRPISDHSTKVLVHLHLYQERIM
jgi:hypothetical protein